MRNGVGWATDVINGNIKTLADLPFHIVERFPHRVLLRHCRGDAIIEISGSEFFEQIRDVSVGLRELGLATGDRVAVVAESRPEWCVTDLAVLAAGGVTVPVYPHSRLDRFATSSMRSHRSRLRTNSGGTRDALVARPDVIALFQEAVDSVNATLAPFETIKRFALIPSEFTIAGGEVTPTMKVRRRVVEDRWRTVIEQLYEEGERPVAGLRT